MWINFLTWYALQFHISLTYTLISSSGALCFAEIGTVIPRNGAEVAYMKEGINIVPMFFLTNNLI
jgi:amino acid transporter